MGFSPFQKFRLEESFGLVNGVFAVFSRDEDCILVCEKVGSRFSVNGDNLNVQLMPGHLACMVVPFPLVDSIEKTPPES